jgi:hypothetical protein
VSPDLASREQAGREKPVVYYFARDLFFGVRLAEGLVRLNLDARPLPAVPDERLLQAAALALVDLSAPVVQWQPLLEVARAARLPVLAFGSHKDQDRWRLAHSLGVTKIVANSQLMTTFPALVRGVMRSTPPAIQGSPPAGTLNA